MNAAVDEKDDVVAAEDVPQPSRLQTLRAEHRSGHQQEFPFAVVEGQAVTELPTDLYIPPEALEVFLEAFEGPLDLLLYLIRRQNLNILDIKVAEITEQYVRYITLMSALQLELAAEYLVMAAMLAEIKSRLLLPRPPSESEDEEKDPRAELVRRLMEYERFKNAAQRLDELPRMDREYFAVSMHVPDVPTQVVREPPVVALREVLLAMAEVLRRAELHQHHAVRFEALSVRERMTDILQRLNYTHTPVGEPAFVMFIALFDLAEGRRGVVVTFLAIMELVRESLIEMSQANEFGPIHVRAAGAHHE